MASVLSETAPCFPVPGTAARPRVQVPAHILSLAEALNHAPLSSELSAAELNWTVRPQVPEGPREPVASTMQISPIEKPTGAQASPHSIRITPIVEQQQQMFLEVTPRCSRALSAPPPQASLSPLLYGRFDRLIPIGTSPLPDWNPALLPSLGSFVVSGKTYRGCGSELHSRAPCAGRWHLSAGYLIAVGRNLHTRSAAQSAGMQACGDACPRACRGPAPVVLG